MKLSTYIEQLQWLLADHGDLDVQIDRAGGRTDAHAPAIAYERILKGRETKASFWYSFDGAERKGKKVVRL